MEGCIFNGRQCFSDRTCVWRKSFTRFVSKGHVKEEERSERKREAEKAWVAGCPLKVPKGQFPVKYTRTVPRRGAWAVSGREIDIKADGVYEGKKYRNILFKMKYIWKIDDILLVFIFKIPLDSDWTILFQIKEKKIYIYMNIVKRRKNPIDNLIQICKRIS